VGGRLGELRKRVPLVVTLHTRALRTALQPAPHPARGHRRQRRGPAALAAGLLLALVLPMLLLLAPGAVQAVSLRDLPSTAPTSLVLDTADVLSRATRLDLEKQLQAFQADHIEARLITVGRLDYGLSLEGLGEELLAAWSPASSQDSSVSRAGDALLLLLIDSQNKAAAVVASPSLEGQLTPELLRSIARTTMAAPLRQGDRYRQAGVDGLDRLATVLRGGEDPGEPAVSEEAVVVSNVPSREETAQSNGFTWVVVLLVVGTVVPMLTWWVFSR
jgi:uncharacterized protein